MTATKLSALTEEFRALSSREASPVWRTGGISMINWKKNGARPEGKVNHLALTMIDIDHYKAYNDTYGHLAGGSIA